MDLSAIDLAGVRRALGDHNPDHEHFLDLGNGGVWTFVFSEATEESLAEHARVVAALGSSHARIPSLSPQEAFEEIEDFVEEIQDGGLRESLFRVLERRGAFRAFREALLNQPEEHRRWRERRRVDLQRRLEGFLSSVGFDTPDHTVEPRD